MVATGFDSPEISQEAFTNRLEKSISKRDAEIIRLRAENISLKVRNERLTALLESIQAQIEQWLPRER